MFGYGYMKGWQAVPIIIPLFLFACIGTIWYFSFHHFKNRPRFQDFSSPMNSSSRQSSLHSSRHSTTSEVMIAGPQDSNHLIHLVDIPPLPAAYRNRRQQGGPVSCVNCCLSAHLTLTWNQAPNAALRAQHSKDSLNSAQWTCRSGHEGHQGISDGAVSSDRLSMPVPQRPQSYVIDMVTRMLNCSCRSNYL